MVSQIWAINFGGILSVCTTLGENPLIRYHRPMDPESGTTTRSMPYKLAMAVQQELDGYCKVNPKFPVCMDVTVGGLGVDTSRCGLWFVLCSLHFQSAEKRSLSCYPPFLFSLSHALLFHGP
ncbi:hypothetical protein BC938DRAFT_478375 [Jimgerdemannia flammicorona]|uniref:Uncharacterized protein n=1 Tax=Jimgerdemannia flammicorona TaxID=994334 RepID=A0A433P5U6_9FUNG|nr:hypothetical protein BC938DRAFT_478375 [Jimgerdemannia flammicorona]